MRVCFNFFNVINHLKIEATNTYLFMHNENNGRGEKISNSKLHISCSKHSV